VEENGESEGFGIPDYTTNSHTTQPPDAMTLNADNYSVLNPMCGLNIKCSHGSFGSIIHPTHFIQISPRIPTLIYFSSLANKSNFEGNIGLGTEN